MRAKLVTALAACVWFCFLLGAPIWAASPLPGDSLYQIKSRWIDEREQGRALSDFRGKPLVVAMIYTRCQATCPLIVSEIKKVEQALPVAARDRVAFALFSFDSDGESAESLKRFALEHSLDLSHWTLLRSDAKVVRELAHALSVRFKKSASSGYAHSGGYTILSADGSIAFEQGALGRDPNEAVATLERLLAPAK